MISWFQQNFWNFITAGIILGVALCLAVITRFICRRMQRHFHKATDRPRRSVIMQGIFYGLSLPLRVFIWLIAFSFIAQLFYENLEDLVRAPIGFDHFRELVFVVAFAWFVLRSRGHIEGLFSAHRLKGKALVEQTQVEALGKLVTLVVLILAVVSILSLFGVDMKALLTIGGLGTVAVGLAGKDVFANFFSGFMLYLTRPFKIGDRIASPDRELEGFVEHIGWYMTRIMTLEKLPTYIPNSIFSTVTIHNYARMRNRRMKETVNFRYEALPVMPQIIEDIQKMLQENEGIDQSQDIYVAVLSYGASAVEVLVQGVTRTPIWGHFLVIKQDVLLKVAEIARRHGVDFAFPTTTVDLQKNP